MLRLVLAAVILVGCSTTSAPPPDAGSPRSDAGVVPSDSGGAIDATSPATDSGAAVDAGTTPGPDGGTVTDPLAAARQACIDEINRLRATRGLTPYSAWTGVEMCVDAEATADETSGTPHGAWLSGTYTCNGSGQNECLGAGVAGIAGCLDSMWAERDQPGCSGCDACADAYDPACPNCDFYGMTTGNVCGHYVNMSAHYFTQAACGFSSLGGWDAINFR